MQTKLIRDLFQFSAAWWSVQCSYSVEVWFERCKVMFGLLTGSDGEPDVCQTKKRQTEAFCWFLFLWSLSPRLVHLYGSTPLLCLDRRRVDVSELRQEAKPPCEHSHAWQQKPNDEGGVRVLSDLLERRYIIGTGSIKVNLILNWKVGVTMFIFFDLLWFFNC